MVENGLKHNNVSVSLDLREQSMAGLTENETQVKVSRQQKRQEKRNRRSISRESGPANETFKIKEEALKQTTTL